MRILAALAFSLAALAPAAAAQEREAPMVSPILVSEDARDSWTFAEPERARVTHVALDLALDFTGQRVTGSAILSVLAAPGAQTLVLDSQGLQIDRVTTRAGAPLAFTIGQSVEGKGEPVTITIGQEREVVIHYAAAPQADALQWLTPEQTAGKQHPYLFSQGQATLNRTWIPTQDSPGIRQTWEARITAPKPLTVVMSGLQARLPQDGPGNTRVFEFVMDKPVAPYLIAIAAGDIVFRELGPRTGVWTEPSMLDAAAAELADTERMVEAAEALYGPYRWGRYDMIVLPPSFPYGGMENPVMTFLTPTFIAGDRSLTNLVAHELAHSWSGNLVTNANWSDSWLNEGVTSYFENRIIEALYGTRRAGQEAALSFAEIEQVLADRGADNPVTALHLPQSDDGSGSESGIVYDKGAAFMRTVETIVGRETFDAWLRQWFDSHAFQPATSAMLLADMRANLVRGDADLERRLLLDEWVYQPGLPANVARPPASAFAEVDAAAAAYPQTHFVDPEAWAGWTTAERLRLLDKLPRELSHQALGDLDANLGLSTTGNNEILFAWLEVALANRYEPAVPVAERFLGEVGRRKFVLPLFEVLMAQGEWGQPIARRIHAASRAGYHAVTQRSVDRVVNAES